MRTMRMLGLAIIIIVPLAVASIYPGPSQEAMGSVTLKTSSINASDQQIPPDYSPFLPQALIELATQYRFGNYSTEEGLSQSVVNDIVQDQQGFIWFGTQDGLNRFDGNEFKTFKTDPEEPDLLSSNYINHIKEDEDGNFWITTMGGGLELFNPRTMEFTHHFHDPTDPNTISENNTSHLCISHDGTVWVSTSNSGLNEFVPQTKTFIRYLNDPANPDSLGSNNVLPVIEDIQGNIWIGTIDSGLDRLDRSNGVFTHFRHDPLNPNSLSSNSVQSLYEDRAGTIWIGTVEAGLNSYNPREDRFTRYQYDPQNPATLSHNSITQIFEDHLGRLWVGTNGGGLNLVEKSTGKILRIRHNPQDSESLPNDYIMSIYEGKGGEIWIGTFGSGAAIYDPLKTKFLLLRGTPENQDGLNSNFIWAIHQDHQKRLWIGTIGGGVNLYDPRLNTWRYFTKENSGLSDNTIYQVFEDRSGRFWIGTSSGLDLLDPVTGTIRNVVPAIGAISMVQDATGMIWIGTILSGLIRVDPNTYESRYYLNEPDDPNSISSNYILDLLIDDQQVLWIGTSGSGLNQYDPSNDRFYHYQNDKNDPNSIRSNTVISLYQSANGPMWVGTDAGLEQFNRQSGTFTHYTEKDGLPNEFIYTILEDEHGSLWLSTNRGLSRFDPARKTFKNFSRTDGLQSDEFNQGSAMVNDQGIMFFGGINGVNIFHPDLIVENPYLPPVVITGFSLFNQPVSPGPDSILPEPVESVQQINLKYTDSFFEFTYSALQFSSPEQTSYAYKMENLDKDWNYVDNRRIATYTNVTPGEYVFRVKAANSDGRWNEQGASLRIIIPPPFWQTTWFRVAISLGALGLIFGAVWLRIRALDVQRSRLEIQVRERTHQLHETMLELEKSRDAAESANRAKSVFLANMSHEFRTPLNAILGFTQIMTRDERLVSDQRENVEIIHRSSEHLLGLINDVLEMSKIEAGRVTVVEKNFDLSRMLLGIEDIFRLRAAKKGLSLSFLYDKDMPECIRADEGKLRQALMNLLGNAVKFTQQGQVRMSVSRSNLATSTNDQAILRFDVEDTGPGIANEDLEKIFEPFVQTMTGQQSQEGTGLGLSISRQFAQLMGGDISVESQLGLGSIFHFSLPIKIISREELEAPKATRKVIGLAPGQDIQRILVVDDNEVNRHLLVRLLTPVGFEVREASNGKEALEIWEIWQPQSIIMDMRMPVMDGYQATRRIKATFRGQAPIIIALTASGLEEDKAVILSEGCDDYVRKPFREEELFEILSKHLGVQYLYQDLTGEEKQGSGLSATGEIEMMRPVLRIDPAWLDNLERATIVGDEQAITILAEEISRTEPELSSKIITLAAHYEHEKILALINEMRKQSNDEPTRID